MHDVSTDGIITQGTPENHRFRHLRTIFAARDVSPRGGLLDRTRLLYRAKYRRKAYE